MTNKDLCEIAIILDRSGSMAPVQRDMEGGLERFIQEQRKFPGRCVVSLYQFDNIHETVFEERPVEQAQKISLTPRGQTALLDAVGRSVKLIGDRLSKKAEHDRPGMVVVMIVTDGHENASMEYTNAQVKALVTEQTEKWRWQFLFLATDVDHFDAMGQGMGIHTNSVYTQNAAGVQNFYGVASSNIGGARTTMNAGGSPVVSMPKDVTVTVPTP